jgi:hypothetical protein
MGVLLAHKERGMSRLLRRTPRRGRPPPPSPTRARQPPRRHPPRLSRTPKPLRRDDRLGTPIPDHHRTSRLTLTAPGVSNLGQHQREDAEVWQQFLGFGNDSAAFSTNWGNWYICTRGPDSPVA